MQKRKIPYGPFHVYKGVNMSVTVSVRLDEEDMESLKEMGLKPGPLMRKLLKDEIRKREALEALEWIRKHSVKTKFDVTQLIREDRDRR